MLVGEELGMLTVSTVGALTDGIRKRLLVIITLHVQQKTEETSHVICWNFVGADIKIGMRHCYPHTGVCREA